MPDNRAQSYSPKVRHVLELLVLFTVDVLASLVAVSFTYLVWMKYGFLSDAVLPSMHSFLFASFLWPFLSTASGHYENPKQIFLEAKQVAVVVIVGSLVLWYFGLAVIGFARSSLAPLIILITIGYMTVLGGRIIGRKIVIAAHLGRRTLILGDAKLIDSVCRWLETNPSAGYTAVLCILSSSVVADTGGDTGQRLSHRISRHGNRSEFPGLEELLVDAHLAGITSAIIADDQLEPETTAALIYALDPVVDDLFVVNPLFNLPTFAALNVRNPLSFRLRRNLRLPWNLLIKRTLDYAVGFLALLILGPIILLISAAILLESGRPVFFSHVRRGRNGVPFRCIKFRTMHKDAEQRLQSLLESDPERRREFEQDFKLRDDPRITAVGRILRRLSLDEIPQFLNVLRGEMAVVGPRPIVEGEVERFGDSMSIIEEVRPGITGLWQISGRSDVSYNERVSLDLLYVREWSPWLDFYILSMTPLVVLRRTGAY